MSREKRAAQCSVDSKETALSLLGDTADEKYPIYMTGDSRSFQSFFFHASWTGFFNTLGTTFQVQYCTLCALFWLTSTRRPWPYTKETQRTEMLLMFFVCCETKQRSLVLCEGSITAPYYSLYLYLKGRHRFWTLQVSLKELSVTPFSEH